MKREIILSFILLLGFFSVPVFAEQPTTNKGISHPGIKWEWKIKADNYTFVVTTVSNYDMQNVTLNTNNKELIFTSNSTHSDNIAEIEIPRNLIGGSLTVIQNGEQVTPIIVNGTNSSTIMLKFNQTGTSVTHVFGTTYLPEFGGISLLVMTISIVMAMFTLKIRKV